MDKYRNKRQKTLDFFVKVSHNVEYVAIETEKTSSISQNETATVNPALNATKNDVCSNENDIGLYVDKLMDISNYKKKELLENHFSPPENFEFPYSESTKCNKIERRYLKQTHLDNYPWAVYSPSTKGVFCKYCFFFVPNFVGESRCNTQVGVLVKKPLTKFAKLLGKDGVLDKHDQRDYHKASIEKAKDFLNNFDKSTSQLLNQLDTERSRQVEENRKKLLPIIDTIITLGRQNISLRGHRDDGDLLNIPDGINKGNFREIMKLRIRAGDTNFEDHIRSAGKNATYLSKTTQNAIIECCADEILDTIRKSVTEAKYFSVMFDETTDISTISQMSVVLRYVHNSQIKEDFIGFFDLHKMNYNTASNSLSEVSESEPKIDGATLGKSVLDVLKQNLIDCEYCVGICTDNCSVMMSEVRGAVSEIQKLAKHAVRIPCYNHSLNLSLSKCSKIQSIRNCFGVIKEVTAFFHVSAKRNFVLKTILGSELNSLCDTRWVEKHDVCLQFENKLTTIVETLKTIAEWQDTVSSTKAALLLGSLLTPQFLVSLKCINCVFSLTLPLSNLFQKKSFDIRMAKDLITDLVLTLESQRKDADELFTNMFEEVSKVAVELEVELKTPRITGRQTKRANYSCETPLEFYRKSVFIPVLDEIIVDLKTRFCDKNMDAFYLYTLLPETLLKIEDDELNVSINKVWDKYSIFLTQTRKFVSKTSIASQIKLWQAKWVRESGSKKTLPAATLDVYNECDEDIYPNIKKMLRILLSLPISVASAERSFSALRRIKTWLRNQMSEERLLGLALLHLHQDKEVDPGKILTRFASSKSDRLNFIM